MQVSLYEKIYLFLKQESPEIDDIERKNVGRKGKTIGKNVFMNTLAKTCKFFCLKAI